MISSISNNQSKPYSTLQNKSVGFKGRTDLTTKFLKSVVVGGVCETAANNPVLVQSGFSLGINCFARPVTNYIVTPDKTDANMASAHSVSSGVVGFLWPLFLVTPFAAAVGVALKKPQKFLKPETIQKFYPTVGIKEVMKDGKLVKEVMTNSKGELVRKDGSAICRELEPIKLKDGDLAGRIGELDKKIADTKNKNKVANMLEEKAELEQRHQAFLQEKAKFEAEHADLTIDIKSGVARSKTVFKTKDGKFQLDDNGNKIGCVVQKDGTPITEELERSLNKEKNTEHILKWAPDILLAVPRSALTVACIPWILKHVFGMEKKAKTDSQPIVKAAATPVTTPSQRMNSIFNKKGGV